MTDDMMNLRTLMEKSPDVDLLREMIGFAAQRLMELEVEGQTAATYGEKSAERLAQRPSATAIAIGSGRPGPARSSCVFPSCARDPTSQLPGAASDGRKGAHRGGAGSLCAGRLVVQAMGMM
jgi:hypothetical protein